MTKKQVIALRAAFRLSTAAMKFVGDVSKLYNGRGLDEKGLAMLALHKEALAELEKESPDEDTIERLLEKMENTAAQNVSKFPPGGISDGWLSNDIAPTARVISREENESLKILSTPQIPNLKNAVNRQSRIDELVYLARKAGKTESDIMDCLSDILNPLSVEQRLNKLIG